MQMRTIDFCFVKWYNFVWDIISKFLEKES